MAWDRRGYYYRSVKIRGRVTREYYGKGPLVDLVARIHAEERQVREATAAARKAERQQLADLDATLDRLDAFAEAVSVVLLEDAGFHRHNGQWRKRRAHDDA
jgi:hypothetical protein